MALDGSSFEDTLGTAGEQVGEAFGYVADAAEYDDEGADAVQESNWKANLRATLVVLTPVAAVFAILAVASAMASDRSKAEQEQRPVCEYFVPDGLTVDTLAGRTGTTRAIIVRLNHLGPDMQLTALGSAKAPCADGQGGKPVKE